MPGDRVWALAYDKTRIPNSKKEWIPCSSFLRGSIAPSFMAVTSSYNDSNGTITLMHPSLEQLTFINSKLIYNKYINQVLTYNYRFKV